MLFIITLNINMKKYLRDRRFSISVTPSFFIFCISFA